MMKNISFFLVLCGFILSTGCRSLYLPNVPATPMFDEKGEVYAAVHTNIKGNVSGNAAIALSDEIAILGGGSYLRDSEGNNQFNQHLYEGAIGYFTRIGKKKDRIFEIYAGYGRGSSEDIKARATMTGLEPTQTRDMDFNKIFVQTNISRKNERVSIFGRETELSYGTVIRGSLVKMSNFQINKTPTHLEENFFIEPIFFTQIALNKDFKLQYTNGFNIGVVGNDHLKSGNAVFTLGLIYKLSK